MPTSLILLVREFADGTYRPYGLYYSEESAKSMATKLLLNPDFDNSPENPETIAIQAWRVELNRRLA